MHPATATTPFTLLWALEKNEEEPPFMSFGAPLHTTTQRLRQSATKMPATMVQRATLGTQGSAQHAAARQQQPVTAKHAQNKVDRDCFAASDFLITNLRPDLFD